MPNGSKPIRRGLKRVQSGRPIIQAGRNVGKRNLKAQKSGRPTPPDQLGFFSGKSMSGMNSTKKMGRATDFSIVNP